MPVGSLNIFPEIIRIALLNNPKKVLDVGVGYGINGAGIRNWFSDVHKREIQLTGIEVFEPYKNPLWQVYDELRNDDIRDVELEQYDVIIMTDVIEHFSKEDGKRVVEKLKRALNPKGVLLISTPATWFEQGAWGGNEHEIHRSLWSIDEFVKMGFAIIQEQPMILAEYINKAL